MTSQAALGEAGPPLLDEQTQQLLEQQQGSTGVPQWVWSGLQHFAPRPAQVGTAQFMIQSCHNHSWLQHLFSCACDVRRITCNGLLLGPVEIQAKTLCYAFCFHSVLLRCIAPAAKINPKNKTTGTTCPLYAITSPCQFVLDLANNHMLAGKISNLTKNQPGTSKFSPLP
jgi:hypothetical protein